MRSPLSGFWPSLDLQLYSLSKIQLLIVPHFPTRLDCFDLLSCEGAPSSYTEDSLIALVENSADMRLHGPIRQWVYWHSVRCLVHLECNFNSRTIGTHATSEQIDSSIDCCIFAVDGMEEVDVSGHTGHHNYISPPGFHYGSHLRQFKLRYQISLSI